MTFSPQQLAQRVGALAAQGVFIGTSSWKYPGWLGTIYDRGRYEGIYIRNHHELDTHQDSATSNRIFTRRSFVR
jgi:hypothetical protein